MADEHAIDVAAPPAEARAAVAQAAEIWGAELAPPDESSPGRLRLAVSSGLRSGWVEGALAVEPLPAPPGGSAPPGSRVTFRPETSDDLLQTPLLAVLLLGAAGALLVVLWPFYPRLLAVAPFGAVLALATWFLVASRLRSRGPAEFLETVAAVVGQAAEEGEAEL